MLFVSLILPNLLLSCCVGRNFPFVQGFVASRPVVKAVSLKFHVDRSHPAISLSDAHRQRRLHAVALLSAIPPSTTAASLALVASSGMGMLAERSLGSSGILVTLATAAISSNLIHAIPSQHLLYDLCWKWILPGSLALLLLGYPLPSTKGLPNDSASSKNTISKAVIRVAGPFVMACLGSILGCWLGYYGWVSAAAQLGESAATSMFYQDARSVVSCLVASYVGGSVNLFATAKLIQAPASLLSSMATADLVAMALYFAVLSASLDWKWLRNLFEDPDITTQSTQIPQEDALPVTSPAVVFVDKVLEKGGSMESPTFLNAGRNKRLIFQLYYSLCLLTLSTTIVGIANRMEASRVGNLIPGLGCGVIAIVTPWLRSIFASLRQTRKTSNPFSSRRQREWSQVANLWADLYFFIFFAAIGVGVDWRSTLAMGPACLMVSVGALAVHLLVTVLGSKLLFSILPWPYRMRLEDVWIASNAAIGGPATAAAFVNRMKIPDETNVSNSEDGNTSLLVGRTMAATVWGVVGYAIGTIVGVNLFQNLGGCLR